MLPKLKENILNGDKHAAAQMLSILKKKTKKMTKKFENYL